MGVEGAVADGVDAGVRVADEVDVKVGFGVGEVTVAVGWDWVQATDRSNRVSDTTKGRKNLLQAVLDWLGPLLDSLSAKVKTIENHRSAFNQEAVDMLAGMAVELNLGCTLPSEEGDMGRRFS